MSNAMTLLEHYLLNRRDSPHSSLSDLVLILYSLEFNPRSKMHVGSGLTKFSHNLLSYRSIVVVFFYFHVGGVSLEIDVAGKFYNLNHPFFDGRVCPN